MKTVITTVGASIFTNYLKSPKGRKDGGARENFEALEKVPLSKWERHNQPGGRIAALRTAIENSDWFQAGNEKLSAEVQSLLTYTRDHPVNQVYLLATETPLSRLAAELIKAWCNHQDQGFTVDFDPTEDVIAGLQVKNLDQFRDTGVQKLIDRIARIKRQKAQTVINISGGYKGVLPILTVMGQLYDISLFYQYEDSEQLIFVDPLPISFDWGVLELYHPFLDNALLQDPTAYEASGLGPKQIEFLRANGLIQAEASHYRLSALGVVMNQYVNQRVNTSSPGLFGDLIELKLFEHYVQKYRTDLESPDRPGKIMALPLSGVKYHCEAGKGDYDLFFEEQAGESVKGIACEIKSVSNIRDKEKDKLKGQFRKYAQCFAQTPEMAGKHLDEIRLIIHKLPYQTRFVASADQLLLEFKQYVEIELGKSFSVYTLNVKVTDKDSMDYQGFMREPLPPDALQPYQF